MISEHQISISELFLKDYVTLNNGVSAAKNLLSFAIKGIIYTLKCIKIEKLL